jgi:NADP-dependent 3-hydroxy acid dehydrogenase YdfG
MTSAASSPPTALITGATMGIGRALAFSLGRAGWAIGVCARNRERVDEFVGELQAAGIAAVGAPADVAVPGEVEAAVAATEHGLGPIQTLINNAGILVGKRIEELTLEEWDATMATNLRSLYLTCRAVLPGMRTRGVGDIVNIASLAGRNGFVGGTAYCASKHAVLGFSKALMLETRKHGLRVIAVCPGSVDTTMLVDQPYLQSNLSRALQPDDVAETVLHALRLPRHAMISELDIRPSNP